MTALQARGKVRGLLAWELVAVAIAFAACHWAMAFRGPGRLEAFVATSLVVRGAFVLIGLSLPEGLRSVALLRVRGPDPHSRSFTTDSNSARKAESSGVSQRIAPRRRASSVSPVAASS